MISALTSSMWPPIETSLRAQYPKIEVGTLAELRSEFERILTETVADVMNSDAPAIYAHYFTAIEMDEMVAFYRTPTGAKALTVVPKAMADIGPAMQARMGPVQGKLTAALENVLKKHGHQVK